MEGWHAGAYLHYLNTKGDDGYEIDYYLNSLGIGLNGGYQFVFSSDITFDLFAGGGIQFALLIMPVKIPSFIRWQV